MVIYFGKMHNYLVTERKGFKQGSNQMPDACRDKQGYTLTFTWLLPFTHPSSIHELYSNLIAGPADSKGQGGTGEWKVGFSFFKCSTIVYSFVLLMLSRGTENNNSK